MPTNARSLAVGLALATALVMLGCEEKQSLESQVKDLEQQVKDLKAVCIRNSDRITLQGRAGNYLGVNDGGLVDDGAKNQTFVTSGPPQTAVPGLLLHSFDGIVTMRLKAGADETFMVQRSTAPWSVLPKGCGACNPDPAAAH